MILRKVRTAAKLPLLLLPVAAAAAAAPPLLARPDAHQLVGTHPSAVVYGYPYGTRCPQAGYEARVDRWGMFMCNCTSYVAWALRANGQRTDWFIPGAMDAWNWPHVARLGHLHVSTRPRPRTIAVWPGVSLPFGHVAYVFGVERNGGVDVSEYNLPEATLLGPFTFDVRRDVPPGGALFISVPERPAARV